MVGATGQARPGTSLVVRGARQHNLKDVTVTIPRDRLVVITGPSGSGKSSLAFDTIYAEGQRRYVESLSAYARQFLDQMAKPEVESIEGLSPAISIEQQTTSRNPRSTVGTVTEIYDYLRLLFARVGRPHCPKCGKPIQAQTVQQIVDRVLELKDGTRFSVLAPVARGRKGRFEKELAEWRKQGFVRVRIDGETRDLGEEIDLDKAKPHDVDVFVDRLAVKEGIQQRLTDSVELALKLAEGLVRVAIADGEEILLSERFACVSCGISLPEITPRMFSFNNPHGACPRCTGLGDVRTYDPDRIIPDPSLSIADGAIAPWGKAGSPYHRYMADVLARKVKVAQDVAWKKLPEKKRALLLNGDGVEEGGWEGVIPGLERRSREYARRKSEEGSDEAAFDYLEEELDRYTVKEPCPECKGARLRPEVLAVTVGGLNIRQLCAQSVKDAARTFEALPLTPREREVASRITREVGNRLGFLVNVGLDYLSLDRAAATLSGGEAERIRLATQIGAGLVGVLYVLDEPSIGLHPRDNDRLIATLRTLRDVGNSVLVVEHDEDTIRAADHVVDMGPGAGRHGGEVVAEGTPDEIVRNPKSLTGQYLSGLRSVRIPATRRRPRAQIEIKGARTHNLKNVDVRIPLGVFTCVTGVSGSGKSSLVIDTLLGAARGQAVGPRGRAEWGTIEGLEAIDKVIDIDQAPIGRTPRSNPATYTGLFTPLREVFAQLPEARARGYGPGRFSFNVKGGRCEACQGDGVTRIEMHFLPDVYVQCDVCEGRRYNRETLEIKYRGLSIADVLERSVEDALEVFSAHPQIRRVLETLRAVGLGYVQLGQSATTLSGGEAQRIKLSRELARRATGRTLYVLDEPTTGLHFSDVEVLVDVLHELVEAGNTVIVIEHNLEVVKTADWVIDLGPEGGDGGGRIIAEGTPEEVARVSGSHTALWLARTLKKKNKKAS
jgi:excinuclease ABC subunit A